MQAFVRRTSSHGRKTAYSEEIYDRCRPKPLAARSRWRAQSRAKSPFVLLQRVDRQNPCPKRLSSECQNQQVHSLFLHDARIIGLHSQPLDSDPLILLASFCCVGLLANEWVLKKLFSSTVSWNLRLGSRFGPSTPSGSPWPCSYLVFPLGSPEGGGCATRD
jgi:hypothetical protein